MGLFSLTRKQAGKPDFFEIGYGTEFGPDFAKAKSGMEVPVSAETGTGKDLDLISLRRNQVWKRHFLQKMALEGVWT